MNKTIVRASYESCLNVTARLSAFTTSTPFIGATEVNVRQDILAADDLMVFCIHARRLVENIGLRNQLNSRTIKTSDGTPLSLWKIIGCLIHHDELLIIRCQTRFKMLQARIKSTNSNEFFKTIENEVNKPPYSEPAPPHVLFKSDKIHYTLINLAEILQVFSEKVIPDIIKKALEDNLNLLDDPSKDIDFSEDALNALAKARSST